MTSRRHHYNPQYYLKGFTESPTSTRLWRYEKGTTQEPILMNITNAGVARDYYAFDRLDGNRDLETVETWLSNEVEQPANPLIERIRNGQYQLSQTEKHVLARYLCATLTRVPRNRQRLYQFAPEIMDEIIRDFPRRMATYRTIFGAQMDNIEAMLTERLHHWRESLPNMLFIPSVLEPLSSAIAQMHWHFLQPANDLKFLTSDNPVLFTERKGLKPPDGEIIFPVSQNVVLWALWKQIKQPVTFEADTKLTQHINQSVVNNAVQYVYSCCNAEWVKELVYGNTSPTDH